ncbi:MAG: hypothetical protein ACK4L7_03800, partial [Flavobacteriales bacterium]
AEPTSTLIDRRVLSVAILAAFVAFLDGTVITVALPAISSELGGGLPVGVLHKSDLIGAVEAGHADRRLADLPPREAPVIGINDDAHERTQEMIMDGLPLLPVVHDRRLVGVLELENLDEFLRLKRAGTSAQPA